MGDFRAVFDDHREFVQRLLRRHGLPARDLPDARQEVFLVAHRRWSSYDPSRPLRSWLHGICHRVACARRRSARRKPELLGYEPDAIDARPSPYDHVATRQARDIALRAIDAMPEGRRDVFVMTEWEERSMPEIARAMGIPLDTAYSRLRLARRDFERHLTRLAQPTADRAA
ncbi:MAG: RNA polymerase sigma factor [Polyangiales bacterium]